MGTYCGNHVLAVVREYCDNAKNGEVTIKKTKEGTCGQLGGCTTAHDDLFQLRYEAAPREEAKAPPTEPEPTPEPEATATEAATETTTTSTAAEPPKQEAEIPA